MHSKSEESRIRMKLKIWNSPSEKGVNALEKREVQSVMIKGLNAPKSEKCGITIPGMKGDNSLEQYEVQPRPLMTKFEIQNFLFNKG